MSFVPEAAVIAVRALPQVMALLGLLALVALAAYGLGRRLLGEGHSWRDAGLAVALGLTVLRHRPLRRRSRRPAERAGGVGAVGGGDDRRLAGVAPARRELARVAAPAPGPGRRLPSRGARSHRLRRHPPGLSGHRLRPDDLSAGHRPRLRRRRRAALSARPALSDRRPVHRGPVRRGAAGGRRPAGPRPRAAGGAGHRRRSLRLGGPPGGAAGRPLRRGPLGRQPVRRPLRHRRLRRRRHRPLRRRGAGGRRPLPPGRGRPLGGGRRRAGGSGRRRPLHRPVLRRRGPAGDPRFRAGDPAGGPPCSPSSPPRRSPVPGTSGCWW